MKHRTWNRFYAWLTGHFWLPCPICGQMFGGHEWEYTVWTKISKTGADGKAICSDCGRAGHGQREPFQ